MCAALPSSFIHPYSWFLERSGQSGKGSPLWVSLWKDLIFLAPGGLQEARKFPSLLCEFTVGLLDQKPGIKSTLTLTLKLPLVPINVTVQQWKSENLERHFGGCRSLTILKSFIPWASAQYHYLVFFF